MPGLGRNIGDAYIDVHGDLGPFRRDVRGEAGRAGAEAGEEFDTSLRARLGRLNLSLGALRKSLRGINTSLAERFEGVDIGLGRLRGSRNDFLNIVGGMAGALENVFGGALRGVFQSTGAVIAGFGRTVAQVNGPIGRLGEGLDRFGLAIGRLGGGGLDGLAIQLGAVIISFQILAGVAGPLASGISGLAAAFTALAVGIGGALAGGLLAIGPGLIALASGIGALTIAFTDLSKSQKAVFKPLQDFFNEVRDNIQGELFKNAGDQVNSLVSALRPLGGVLSSLAGVFSDWATDVLAAVGPGGALSRSFDTLGTALPGLLRNTLNILSGLGGALTGLFAGATPGAQRLFEAISRVVGRFSEWANSVQGQAAINDFVQQAIDLLGTLWDLATQVGTTLKNLWNLGAAEAAQEIIQGVVGVFEDLNKTLSTPEGREATLSFFRNGVAVMQGLGPVLRAIINLFNELDSNFNRIAFQKVLQGITGVVNAITSFVAWTARIRDGLIQFALTVRNTINSLSNLGARAAQAGAQFRTTLSNAFQAVSRAVAPVVQRILSLRSPMTIAGQAGQRFRAQITSAFQAVSVGIANYVARVRTVVLSMATTISQAVSRAAAALQNLVVQSTLAMARFMNSIRTGVTNAISALTGFATRAAAALGGIATRFYTYGVNAMQGLYNGVVSAGGRVISYIRGLAEDVAGAFASVLGIASPSKLFRTYGGNIIDGLVNGMRRRENEAKKEGDALAQSVIDGAQAGLQRARQSLQDTVREVLRNVAQAGNNPFLTKAFQTLGRGMITALTNGLSRGRENAADDIKNIVESIGKITRRLMEGEDRKTRASIASQGSALQQWVKSQGAALDAVWREVDRAGTRIESARERLKDLQNQFAQLRDSTMDSLRGELDLGGAIDQESGKATFDSVASQVSGLASRMKTFARLLKRLIKEGLPPALVQEVAALGSVQGAEVARALLSGTDAQRASLVSDFRSIQESTRAIGTALAEQMFGAGIEAQKGLIKGLEANRAALIAAAKRIAKTITDEVKRELGIRSPSTVFQDIGANIVEGLARGIENGGQRVGSALTGLVDPKVLENVNAPISALAGQGNTVTAPSYASGGIAPGAITIVTPYANPRLVAIEALDALAAQGK